MLRQGDNVAKDTLTARPRADIEEEALDEPTETFSLEAEREQAYELMGQEWEPATVVIPGTPGRDGVPTCDDDLDIDIHAAPREYPDYHKDETFVITYTLGPDGRFPTRREAARFAAAKYGHIYQVYGVPGKFVARVRKPRRSED